MRTLLFLSHRFPCPPDRGEKIRIWHLIQHLARSHRVFLGCLVDDPRDWAHRAPLEALCAGTGCFGIDKRRQKLRALARIRPGRPLMLEYYHHGGLHRWVSEVAARERIDVVYVFSTAMAPYAAAVAAPLRILDMVDIDSEKWAEYARRSAFPARLVWAREARTLLDFERRAALAHDRALLVTEAECRRFEALAPESRGRVDWLENGVDLAFFDPSRAYPDPYPEPGPWLCLVGNMDYWPNQDAAAFCAQEILPQIPPRLARLVPRLVPRLAIVGANPGPATRRLASLPGVMVTGRVADVRPYLAHAAVVVAPLRIARGVQNKVLEGMAMARPVVATRPAFEGILAEPGRELLVADDALGFAGLVAEVLAGRHAGLGQAARNMVERRYSWPARLARLDEMLA